MLSLALVFAAVAPGYALAAEAESEQEGTAPPGALPGLEEAPDLEPGGEEAALEDLPGVPVGSEEEAPLETEPAEESEVSVPATSEPSSAPPPGAEEVPPTAPPPAPEYGPVYEPTPLPGSTPVENESIVAPAQPASAPVDHKAEQPEAITGAVPEETAPQAPVEEAPQPEPAPPATTTGPGGLSGRQVHVVRAGECLWSIARSLLPADAGTAAIVAEVQRLWRLNEDRIGTGDPSLIYVGTELLLR